MHPKHPSPVKLKPFSSPLFFCLILFCPVLFLSGCAGLKKEPPAPRPVLERVSPSAYPAFNDDMAYDGLRHAILQSITYFKRIPSDRNFDFGPDRYTSAHLIRTMEHFLNFIQTQPSPDALKSFIRSHYRVYRSTGNQKTKKVLFTGYYEPILSGRTHRNGTYRYPVYARPEDHTTIDLSLFHADFKGRKIVGRYTNQRVVPYYDRRKIDKTAALKGKAPVLAWVKDEVGLFFLQIQGSGKIFLENGSVLNVHYHTANGHPYRSIGKLLIDKGKIPRNEMSMQRIRTYLHDHPDEVEAILHYNPSYVFFKIEKDGPLGYLSVKLTPGRSIALDRRIFPPAALCFIETKIPFVDGVGKIYSWNDSNRFTLNQDTGGAIRGAGRADLFWGNGAYAEIAAGHMQHRGDLYFLVLKPTAS